MKLSLSPVLLTLALGLPACASRPSPPIAGQRQADRASAERGELHTERVRASFGDSRELAKSLRQLFDVGSPGAQVSAILVDPNDHSLVIVGREAGTAAVHRLVDALGRREPTAESSIEVLPLTHADARDVTHTLAPMLRGNPQLSVDQRTNRLLIQGDAEGRQTVKRLVAALDVAR